MYTYPFDEGAVSERNKSVTQSVTSSQDITKERNKPLAEVIEEWVRETTAWFTYDELDKDLGIQTKDKANRRNIIKRLKDSKVVESHPTDNKKLRYINEQTIKVDYKQGRGKVPLNIVFPFAIEEYFNCYSKNIIVLAGSPDSGKTAWLLNFIKMNQDKWNIYYQSSEMGETELASRLENFEDIDLEDWKFIAEERSAHFADVIRPDDINIIDYMELTSEVYLVAEYLREIHDKLNNGIAIVALQKKRNAELGRGGEFSLEKPRLYLSMDAGKMTIQKAKNWASSENPNGKYIKFKIVKGCQFHITDSWADKDE